MIVMAGDGLSDTEQGRRLGVDRQRAQRWRRRWLDAVPAIDEAEAAGASDRDLRRLIEGALSDGDRAGSPGKFSAEQVAALISLACEPPGDSDLPITHWTPAELASEAVKRGIVESISPRHLDRLMKRGRPQAAQEQVLDDLAGQAGGP
jgi:hypothetical protein